MFNVLKEFRKLFGPWVVSTPPRPKPRPTVKPCLEVLEGRDCPSTVTTWQPLAGSQDGNSAANYTNGLPSLTNILDLDGSAPATNKPIEFSKPISMSTIQVINGYNNALIIDNGGTITTTPCGTSMASVVNSGCTLAITSADLSGIELTNGVIFNVATGGTLKLTDPAGATSGGTYFSENDGMGERLLNQGITTWTGTASAPPGLILDTISAPVYNSGVFNANGGTGGQTSVNPGTLYIFGQVSSPAVSFYQASGSFNLSNLARVVVNSGYFQSGGSLTSDSTPVGKADVLQAGPTAGGDIRIGGGKVIVDNVANSVGTLQFKAATVEFNGELDVSGEPLPKGQSTLCDVLDCTGAAVSLGTNGYLDVSTTGGSPLGTGNQWVVMKYASISGPGPQPYWATTSVPTGMNVSVGATQVLVSN